jgi:hypothetical protein
MRPLLFTLLLLAARPAAAGGLDHSAWDGLLRRHVNADAIGLVDYPGLATERESLDAYLASLAAARPAEWGPDERLAFWINAYNAWMVALVLDHYPIRGTDPAWPSASVRQVEGIFKQEKGLFAGRRLSLDEIEHEIIRKRFDEPRIHFALVCAAASCPKLRSEAYTGERLDGQLDAQVLDFLAVPEKNQFDLDAGVARLSPIFDWFAEDFADAPGQTEALKRAAGKHAGALAFLTGYRHGKVRRAALEGGLRVELLPYDWTLNDHANPPGRDR